MRVRILSAPLVAAVLLLPTFSAVQAQSVSHPIIGTWSVNVERSSYEPGPGPQAVTRAFIAEDDGFVTSISITVTASGNPLFAMTRFKLDGVGYEVWSDQVLHDHLTGEDASPGTAALRVVDDRTVELIQKNADGEVSPFSPRTLEVSSDGSTLSFRTSGTTTDGVTVDVVEVYDRVPQNPHRCCAG